MKKPTMPDVLPLIKEYISKPNNGAGGSLHLVLEDCNVEDSHVQFCLEYANNHNDLEGYIIAELLLQMSKTQRIKLSMMAWEDD